MILKVNDKSINYDINGKGDPIILVHGWGGNSKSLEDLAELLSAKYQAITLDLPGFGQSSSPNPDWGVVEYAKFLIDFVCELKIKPVIFFGHSFGGALGIYLAVKYPDYIKKLVVSGASYKRKSPAASKISRLFRQLPPELKKIIYKILFPGSDLYKVPELETNFRKIVTQDLTPYLKSIKIPTLILWGARDQETPLSHAHELQRKIKSSKIKIFPKLGHNLPLQYPKLIFAEIEKFL